MVFGRCARVCNLSAAFAIDADIAIRSMNGKIGWDTKKENIGKLREGSRVPLSTKPLIPLN